MWPSLPSPGSSLLPQLFTPSGDKRRKPSSDSDLRAQPLFGFPRRTRIGRASRQDGYALLLALVVIFLVFIALALVFAALALRLRQAQLETQTVHLVALSDAGMAEALAGLARDPGFPGTPWHELARGSVSSQIEPVSSKIFRVTTQVSYAGRGRGAQAMVQMDAPGQLRVMSWQRIAPESSGSNSFRQR
jgi:hypothetical protein